MSVVEERHPRFTPRPKPGTKWGWCLDKPQEADIVTVIEALWDCVDSVVIIESTVWPGFRSTCDISVFWANAYGINSKPGP